MHRNIGVPVAQSHKFSRCRGRLPISHPQLILSRASRPGNWTPKSFRLDFLAISDEHGSGIKDYLQYYSSFPHNYFSITGVKKNVPYMWQGHRENDILDLEGH